MQSNILKSKILSFGLVALSAVSVATTAMESEEQKETSVSNLTSLFESPQKTTSFPSQTEGDNKTASPVASRNIALHLKGEAELRAAKLVEAAQLVAQADIDEIKKGVESIRTEAELEIKKIREGVELEKAKASELRKELADLNKLKLELEAQNQQLQKDVDDAKADALITKSGIVDGARTAASYFNPWAYVKTPQPNNSSEIKSTNPD